MSILISNINTENQSSIFSAGQVNRILSTDILRVCPSPRIIKNAILEETSEQISVHGKMKYLWKDVDKIYRNDSPNITPQEINSKRIFSFSLSPFSFPVTMLSFGNKRRSQYGFYIPQNIIDRLEAKFSMALNEQDGYGNIIFKFALLYHSDRRIESLVLLPIAAKIGKGMPRNISTLPYPSGTVRAPKKLANHHINYSAAALLRPFIKSNIKALAKKKEEKHQAISDDYAIKLESMSLWPEVIECKLSNKNKDSSDKYFLELPSPFLEVKPSDYEYIESAFYSSIPGPCESEADLEVDDETLKKIIAKPKVNYFSLFYDSADIAMFFFKEDFNEYHQSFPPLPSFGHVSWGYGYNEYLEALLSYQKQKGLKNFDGSPAFEGALSSPELPEYWSKRLGISPTK